jgi:autotransporter adhesin
MTGSNDRGSYTGKLVSKDGTVALEMAHTTAAGAETDMTIKTAQDGSTHEVVKVPAAHLTLTADIDAKNGGTGILEELGDHPLKVGDVSWDADGLATIKLADGSSFQARLF